jgi:hypothetical protein
MEAYPTNTAPDDAGAFEYRVQRISVLGDDSVKIGVIVHLTLAT